ncbi:MAG: hypothetical protein EZS28_027023 [Streblomastix strix]|uniref:Uncharacterized protein n=1 Tax=Streblomastix strix TaxID=222440 RepID=A0A5J4V581_9EUKA|nr:MAG: hypothetical protein EZS28_027023 [Streblomastix strix]
MKYKQITRFQRSGTSIIRPQTGLNSVSSLQRDLTVFRGSTARPATAAGRTLSISIIEEDNIFFAKSKLQRTLVKEINIKLAISGLIFVYFYIFEIHILLPYTYLDRELRLPYLLVGQVDSKNLNF